MNDKILNYDILKMAILPVLGACCFTACAYLISVIYELDKNELKNEKFVEEIYDGITQLDQTGIQYFNNSTKALLKSEYFLSASLYNKEIEKISHQGLPFDHEFVQKFIGVKNEWQEQGKKVRCIPLHSGDGWVTVVTKTYRKEIIYFRTLVIAIFMSLIAGSITYWYSQNLKKSILKPIRSLQNGLHRLINGNYNSPIRTENQGIFKSLVRDINRLAMKQKSANEEAQKTIELATSELRETLETVEIQNIEIDLARKNAVESNKLKSEFLANTSHEIRTPLNGIIGFTELLHRTQLTSQQHEYLSTIEESAKSLLISINDIIDFSRLEIGKLNLDYKPVFLRQIVEESLQLAASQSEEKNLRLINIIDNKIPKQLLGDPLRLKQVLTNLIINVIKFSEQGNILVNASMENRIDNQVTLQFKVSNSQHTLSSEDYRRIQQLFSNPEINEYKSLDKSGMGLIIAKGLTDRMAGSIGVTSKEGAGTTFWFSATLGRIDRSNTPMMIDESLNNIHAIVYDNEVMGKMEMEHLISSWGAKVKQVESFAKLADDARNAQGDADHVVVIFNADISNASFSKTQLESMVKELQTAPQIPIIAFTTQTMQHIIAPILNFPNCSVLQRPVLSKLLFDSICKNIGINPSEYSNENVSMAIPQKISILAVDDNPSNLKLVSELLKDLNVEVTSVDSGESALEVCEHNRFSLILMDIQMPGLDGFETTRELRSRENGDERTPVVALTAHAIEEEKSKLLLAGMDDFLSKPVGERELVEVISRWTKQDISIPMMHEMEPSQITSNPSTNSSVVDITTSLKLAKGKADLAKDMLNMLLGSLEEDKKNINLSITDENFDRLQEIVHKLHGGCCYCGVPTLLSISAKLDKKLKNKDYSDLESDIKSLIIAIDELIDWSDNTNLEAVFG